MKKILHLFLAVLLTIGTLPIFSSCATNFTTSGFENYFEFSNDGRHLGFAFDGNSSVEIDWFGDILPLYTDYNYVDGNYHYSLEEDFPVYNILERAIIYFEYAESDYQSAKTYCRENLSNLGEEITEEYNHYKFYDLHGKREKEDYYHCDDYPQAFQRVAFNDEKYTIVFVGIYTTDKRADQTTEDVKNWGNFLQKYFFEFYSFDK